MADIEALKNALRLKTDDELSRINNKIDAETFARLKSFAKQNGQSMRSVIEDALNEYLDKNNSQLSFEEIK